MRFLTGPSKWILTGLLVPACASLLGGSPQSAGGDSDSQAPAFVRRGNQVEELYRAYVAAMREYHEALLATLKADAPDLLPILSPEPPKPVPYGYQLLPQWISDVPLGPPGPLSSTSYTWSRTEGFIVAEVPRIKTEAEKLANAQKGTPAERHSALQQVASGYSQLEKNQLLIDQHVQYNRFWQQAIADDPVRFNNETLLHDGALERQDLLIRLQKPELDAGERASLTAREKDLAARIHSHGVPAIPGFVRPHHSSSGWTLRVRIYTDILDTGFVAAVKQAIESKWQVNDGGEQFRVQIDMRVLKPERLYRPEPQPAAGSHIDVGAHISRFPRDGGILTTGANSMYAISGRYIILGTAALSPNVIAHEFGHLLGFNDGYFRGYRDRGEQGYEVMEVVPDPADIMCNPGAGKVFRAHFDKILRGLENRRGSWDKALGR
jgi:hypothetical protein